MSGHETSDSAGVAAALRQALDDRLTQYDRPGAVALALDAVRSGKVTIDRLYAEVLGPLMADTGSRWQQGETAVWEEHFASATVRTIVDALYPDVRAAIEARVPNDRIALLACPPQEQHDLGLRMLADRLELGGWTAHFLGADTPATEVEAATRTLGADTIILSVATHYHRVMLRAFVDSLRRNLPAVRILAGGPALEHDRTGWSDDEIADVGALLATGSDASAPPRNMATSTDGNDG